METTELRNLGQFDHTTQDVNAHEAVQGMMAARRNANAQHQRRVNEAARLMANVISGQEDPFLLKEAMFPKHDYAVLHLMEKYPGIFSNAYSDRTGRVGLRETMSVSDYTALSVDVLDRMFYGYYNVAPVANKALVKQVSLRDFRTVKRFIEDGATTPLTIVKNGSPNPERAIGPETVVTYYPDLYASNSRINWRAIVNDDLGIFQDLPKKMAIQGIRAIQQFITGLYVQSSGLNTSLYKASFTNQITIANGAASNNPALSIQGIQDAFKVLAKMKDADGYPIVLMGSLYLWYGPALIATANNLMNLLQSYIQVEGGTSNAQGFPAQFVNTNNWAVRNLNPIMDQFIPIVCTTATTQDTLWGITYDPNAQNRPSLEMGFLTGFDTPQLYQKVPNTMRIGGGVDPTLGDWRSMDQELKIITVFGGTQIDGRSTVASTGRGV
jgi:hypothetical protein